MNLLMEELITTPSMGLCETLGIPRGFLADPVEGQELLLQQIGQLALLARTPEGQYVDRRVSRELPVYGQLWEL